MALPKAKELVSSNPVVVFSKSYCPFCVSVKKLLTDIGATYKAIELDTESCSSLQRLDTHSKTNEQTVQEMLNLAIKYNKAIQEEDELPPEKLAIANVERQDAKKHLEEHVSNLMSSNIIQTLGTMVDVVVF